MRRTALTALAAALALVLFGWPARSEGASTGELKPYRGIIHVHTTFSTGELSADEIVARAKQAGISIIVFTDHELVRVGWGVPPFRNLVSRIFDHRPSVLKIGVDLYFNAIEKLQRENPGMVILPGIETAPFYYVSGDPIFGKLKIHDWRRHILMVGLGREAVRNLPVLNNGMSTRYFGALLPGTLYFLIPMMLSLPLLPFRGWVRWVGAAIFLVGLVGTIDAHPFRSSPFSIYNGPQGVRPYQELINYTEEKGGFALWAHQGSLLTKQEVGPGVLETKPYTHVLAQTVGYWAFDAIYEDNFRASLPGQVWDKYLVAYLLGQRPRAIWGYGGVDFHSEREMRGRKRIGNIQNVFFLDELSEDAFIRSLVNGRFYVVRGYTPARLQLDYFRIISPDEKTPGSYGDDVRSKGPPRITFQVSTRNGAREKVRAQVIRMGRVSQIFEGTTPMRVDYVDRDPIPHPRFFYRLDVKGKRGEHIVSNPIFVRR
ncbi:MAG: PHP domain-containing protein [bacterium]